MARRGDPVPSLRLDAHKARTMEQPLRVAPAPVLAVVALDQGGAAAPRPVVDPGARVRIGTPIARLADGVTATVHAPVAGTVREIGTHATPSRVGTGTCIVIDNDGSDATEASHGPLDWNAMNGDRLLEHIREAGIVGLGGAAFSTAAKMATARDRRATQLVLNGAECEPWICCDDALMRERADDVVLGARVMMHAIGAGRCTVAVEDDKPDAIASLGHELAAAGDDRIRIAVLPAVYPAGAERQLLAAVTGREVPHDSLPPSIGLLCQNVATAAAVARLVRTGEPSISRIVTVTGSGVARPANLEARIGTPLAQLVAACGGYRDDPRRLIAGGTMMGLALDTDDAALTKAVNCVLAATSADLVPRGTEMPCIRCGDCARACPVGLLPQQLHLAAVAHDARQLERHGLADCIECGCCDYVCPSAIPLTERFRAARAQARMREDARNRAEDARDRFERHERRLAALAASERAAFDDARRQARGAGPHGA
jgi:electron transport complex protein RnfC